MIRQRLRRLLRHGLNLGLKPLGYEIAAYDPHRRPDDFDLVQEEQELGIFDRVRPYTMTGRERISMLCRSVEYVVTNGIPGAIVECGVWRGGSMMAAALRLQQLGACDRMLHLFDTFEGMPPATDRDQTYANEPSAKIIEEHLRTHDSFCESSLVEVQAALRLTDYPEKQIVYVKGRVEDTLPAQAPETIALLRLDTDWYESTWHELVHLYPRLAVGGVLILDDYGYWKGAKEAVDEYIRQHKLRLLLNRIDHSARIAVKLDP